MTTMRTLSLPETLFRLAKHAKRCNLLAGRHFFKFESIVMPIRALIAPALERPRSVTRE